VAWVDFVGFERQTLLTSSAGAPGTIAQLAAMTNAGLTVTWEGPLNALVPGPTGTGAYIGVGDTLALQIVDAFGNFNQVFVPAPPLALFPVDGQTLGLATPQYFLVQAAVFFELMIPLSTSKAVNIASGYLMRRTPGARETYICGPTVPMYRRTVVWQDAQGKTGTTILTSLAGAGVTMGALSANFTNATPIQWWEGLVTVYPAPLTVNATYPNVQDAARFVFADAGGNIASVTLPAPVASLFLADQETVDLTNVQVAALAAVVASELVHPTSGQPLTTLWGGRRRRDRLQGAQ
jgi:hypothetical protein